MQSCHRSISLQLRQQGGVFAVLLAAVLVSVAIDFPCKTLLRWLLQLSSLQHILLIACQCYNCDDSKDDADKSSKRTNFGPRGEVVLCHIVLTTIPLQYVA